MIIMVTVSGGISIISLCTVSVGPKEKTVSIENLRVIFTSILTVVPYKISITVLSLVNNICRVNFVKMILIMRFSEFIFKAYFKYFR